MSELTIPERVAAGAAWLDKERPGWWQRINLDTLDLGDPCKCVLGQEFGHFGADETEGAYRNAREAAERGYEIRILEDWTAYGPLTDEWRRLIESRRSGAVS